METLVYVPKQHSNQISYDYSYDDIVQALVSAGINKGDIIFIHSNVGYFGRLEGAATRENFYYIFKRALTEVLGEAGTFVVPAFSYSFCWGKPYNKILTPSVCGVFTELVRSDNMSYRSDDANFSVVAVGRDAEYLTADAPEFSYGVGSFWEKFLQRKGKLCNFNFPPSSTFIHYVERCLKVPYRYDKPFTGIALVNGKEVKKTFYHFCYDLNKLCYQPDFSKFDQRARERKFAKSVDLGRGQVVVVSAEDSFKLIEEEIVRDQAFLIKGPLEGSLGVGND